MKKVFLGTGIIDADACFLSAFERGYLYADGIFETVRIAGGKPLRLDRHMERMKSSAAFFSLPFPAVEIEKTIEILAAENSIEEGAARITLSRGPLPSGPRPSPEPSNPTLLITVRPLPADHEAKKTEGVSCRTLPWPLRAGGLPLEGHKTLAYLASVLALGTVGEGEEPLLETLSGHLSEGAATNVFWIRDKILFTPSIASGCLPGIMRAQILLKASEAGIETREGLFPLADLKTADEAFLTNAVMGVVPVKEVDGKPVGRAAPGPMTRNLARLAG